MSQLIEDLKSAHVEISGIFLQVAKLGITSEEGQRKLFHAKSKLFAHLKKEDEELYRILWEKAENNQGLKLKLESFARGMDSVTGTIIAFFEKYSGGEVENDFKNDFNKIYTALIQRINSEESELFPEYEKLNLD